MTRLSEYDIRLSKRQQLLDMGIAPYAQKWDKKQMISDLIAHEGETMRDIETILVSPTTDYSTAGRVMLYRSHGKLSFAKLMDETAEIQLMFHRVGSKLVPQTMVKKGLLDLGEDFQFAEKFIDVGDIIGVRGELFVTHKGELTLFVSEFQLLSKALKPLGDKWHGIGEDNQERAYRQRYLDMIFNRETLERMRFRSDFIKTLREFYWNKGFIEIDCPVLTPSASGAAAKPFVTYHNDFDREFYLRICNETELKKATVGGFEKVFTLGTDFRNEGSDPSHLQEFMMLEHQAVYKSFHEDMDFTQEMFDHIFDTLKIERRFEVKDKLGNPKMVDFTTPRPRIDYVEGVNKASGLDITSYTIDDSDGLRADIRAKGIEFEGMDAMGTMTLIDYLYKKVLRPTITGPAFIYNYPSIIAPLARISDDDPRKCEKWQVVVNGREIINSYGELVDPVRQKENFDEQSKAEEGGDTEATSADLEFVKAMEYGMPIQAGFGMGIDRMIALIAQQENLRDVVMFPLMKPENNGEGGMGNDKGKNNDLKIAVALLNEGANLLPRQEMNTIAHLNAAFGARIGKGLFMKDTILTADDAQIKLNIQHAIMIKEITNSDAIRLLIAKAKELGLEVSEFTREMIETTNDNKVSELTKNKKYGQVEYLGLLLFGDKKIVDELTKEYQLYSRDNISERSSNSLHTNPPNPPLSRGGGDINGSNQGTSSSSVSDELVIRADALAAKYLSSTLLHCQQVAGCMRYFAKKSGKSEGEQNYRYVVGLLHDVDWDAVDKNADLHTGEKLEEIIAELGLGHAESMSLQNDIRSHYQEKRTSEEYALDTDVRKYLISIDELSGLLYAYARMRGGSFDGMEVSGVMKKIKDVKFAAGVSRDHVRYCETALGISLEDFVGQMIEAMQAL